MLAQLNVGLTLPDLTRTEVAFAEKVDFEREAVGLIRLGRPTIDCPLCYRLVKSELEQQRENGLACPFCSGHVVSAFSDNPLVPSANRDLKKLSC
jgi:hypothetical protein